MAQQTFPLDPVQTQITKPVTNVTAPPVAPPQQTGLSQGLALFGKALGSAADFAKARQFDEELKIAELDAARGRVSPGLVSQKAIDLNRKMLDVNFASDFVMQAKTWKDNAGSNIANNVTLTSIEKATRINNTLNTYREQLKYITHSGEAYAKADLALKTYKHELYTSIGQFDLQAVLQAGAKSTKIEIESAITTGLIWPEKKRGVSLTGQETPGGELDVKFAKKLENNLKDLQVAHKTTTINGKTIHLAANWDERKAVFSLMSGSVLEHLGDRPELFYQFEKIIKEHYQPLADLENAQNVQGKGNVIGDHTTLQSLIDGYRSGVDEYQKKKDKENKDGDERWVSGQLFGLLAKNPNLREVPKEESRPGGDIFTHCGGNAYCINKVEGEMNKYIKNDKYGTYTGTFYKGLKEILAGRYTDEQQIESFGLNNRLSPTAISDLKSDLTEKREDIQNNITRLKDRTPLFTKADLKGALGLGIRSEYISKKLQDLGISLEDAMTHNQLQGIVAGANNLRGAEEIIGPLKKIQTYLRKTDELRMKLAREAAYRRDSPDITEQDIKEFEKERFDRFKEILKEYTEAVEGISPKKP